MLSKTILMALAAGMLVPLASARAADCNGNGTPDASEPDCNANGLPDDCDIAGKIYWSDSGGTDRIVRAYLSGARVENLITSGLSIARGIAVDPVAGNIYWTDAGLDHIARANLDGTGVEHLVMSGLSSPQGIALDVDAGMMYWADPGTDKIQRANVDGPVVVQDLVTTGLTTPQSIALDVAAGKMYWTDFSANRVQRANLDGSGVVETLVTTGSSHYGIALDTAGGYVYWTEWGTPRIRRLNLAGGSPQIVNVITTHMWPSGIAVDSVGGRIYWTDWGTDKIQSANLDGTDVDDLPIGGLIDAYVLTLALPLPDADTNGIPDECEGTPPSLLSAVTSKPNVSGPDGFCDLPIDAAAGAPITSEPRIGGITEVIFIYDAPPGGTLTVESDCTCPSPPDYQPVDPPVSCATDADTLVCTFDPALPNACTYRFTVPSAGATASVELRGLTGDVDGSGRVNSTDRSAVVAQWTGPNRFSCGTDLDGNGVTHSPDRSTVVGFWTGAFNCAP